MDTIKNNIAATNSAITSSGGNSAVNGSSAARYLPEPSSSGIGVFQDVMNLAGNVLENAPGILAGNVNNIKDVVGLNGDFKELLAIQIEAQKELQTVTMVSNVEKSRHEAKMSPVRNIRVN